VVGILHLVFARQRIALPLPATRNTRKAAANSNIAGVGTTIALPALAGQARAHE